MKYILHTVLLVLFSLNCQAQETANAIEEHLDEKEVFLTTTDTVKNKKGQVLQEVIVTAKQQQTPLSIEKSGIKPMDLPQSTAVISHATLKNQQVANLSDALKNVNGVYIMGTTGGYQSEVASRGFPLGSSNTFKNGIRYFNGMPTEMSGIESIQFLKGSAALLYGNVTPGGIMNLVTKKPRFDFGGNVGYRFGSFGIINPTIDLYGSIGKNKKSAFRVNGTYEKADSFRKFVEAEKYYVNPSFIVNFNPKLQLIVEGDYLNTTTTPDFGAGIINYEIVDIPRDRFLGVTWGYFDAQQVSATATLNYQISEKWSTSFINSFRNYNTDLFSNTRPNSGVNGTVKENGDWTRSIQKADAKDNYYIQQLDFKGNFNTGKITHQVLVGYNFEMFKTTTTAYKNFNNYDTINIFENYNPALQPAIPTLDLNTLTTAPINTFGAYAQDLISFSEKWKLLAGISYNYQDTDSEVLTYDKNKTVNTSANDDAFSPRIGLVYQPTKNNTLFASYSNSFEVNTGQDVSGNPLTPSIIDQYEIGTKNILFDGRLFLNATIYQITNDKYYQQSLLDGNTYSYIKVLAGEVRSRGVEIDAILNPTRGLTILGGYSFNQTEIIESDYYTPGTELKYNPKNTANLSANYQILSGKLTGLNFGIINSYVGDRYAGRLTRTQVNGDSRKLIFVAGYYQLDATIAYTYKKVNIAAKLSNITNALNYNIHDDNSLNPIAPRVYSVNLNYNF
jgi:iron complex outermembrane receptor protein